MKKFTLILFVSLLTFGVYGCKKDLTEKPAPEKAVSKLEGTWKVSYTEYNYYGGDNSLVDTYTETENTNSQATFNTDGTGSFTSGVNEKMTFNYAFSESKLSFTNVKYSGSNNNYKSSPVVDLEYTDVKLGVNELTYTRSGTLAQPAFYSRFVAKVHLIK